MDARGTVPGTQGGRRTMFYGLSTCVWCRKARQLLEELDVPFDYTYVDLLTGGEKRAVLAELARHGLEERFPAVIVDDETRIVGFKPDEIRRAYRS